MFRILPFTLLLFLAWLLPARSALAELLPHEEPRAMTELAEWVIEAEVVGETTVRVLQTYVPSARRPSGDELVRLVELVELPDLARLTRRTGPLDAEPDTTRQLERAILFLEYDEEREVWRPVHTYGEGSQGVWWIDGERVHRYAQWMNPGGYSLTDWERPEALLRTKRPSADALRADVKAGAAGRALMARATATRSDRRARELWVEYLSLPSPSTQVAARALSRMPGSARALTRALTDADDAHHAVALLRTLRDLGEEARDEADTIARMAEHPGDVPLRAYLETLIVLAPGHAPPVARRVLDDAPLRDAAFAAAWLSNADVDASGKAGLDTALLRRMEAAPTDEDTATALRTLLWVLVRAAPEVGRMKATEWANDERFAPHHRDAFRQFTERE